MVDQVKKKKWWIIPLVFLGVIATLGIGIFVLLKNTILMTFPELKGEPEVGSYYAISPEGALTSTGKQWHGIYKKGSENKTVVYFFGGGASITEETSKRGKEFYAVDMTAQDFVAKGGIGNNADSNPFKNWNFVIVPYTTGDFHTGTAEFRYTENGKEKIIYHQGYKNYTLLMNSILKYVEDSDTLLVTGFSAGGFATSLLADDVIGYFPKATNITVTVDSSLLLYDGWKDTATNLWKSPKEISDRLTTNNIVLDSLTALHEKCGDQVKILFDCSYRDDTLQQYQAYINYGKMEKNKANGDLFQKDLKDMVSGLQTNIPNVGIYIWDYKADSSTKNTQHTIISSDFLVKLEDGKSIADWMINAVNGDVKTYGLHLLDK
ncbi:MAG: pectin acetylesterase [Clostridia bacterium]|nr:pectin acetylesterase [Clostridia bacterium]